MSALISNIVSSAKDRSSPPVLNDQDVEVINEVLKALFNITLHVEEDSMDEEDESRMVELADWLQSLFTIGVSNPDLKISIQA